MFVVLIVINTNTLLLLETNRFTSIFKVAMSFTGVANRLPPVHLQMSHMFSWF